MKDLLGELVGSGIVEYVYRRYSIDIREADGPRIFRSNYHANSIIFQDGKNVLELTLDTVMGIDGKTYKVGYSPPHKLLVVSQPFIPLEKLKIGANSPLTG